MFKRKLPKSLFTSNHNRQGTWLFCPVYKDSTVRHRKGWFSFLGLWKLSHHRYLLCKARWFHLTGIFLLCFKFKNMLPFTSRFFFLLKITLIVWDKVFWDDWSAHFVLLFCGIWKRPCLTCQVSWIRFSH